MSVQGHLLDITVIGCRNLKDTEWLSRQDPYVILEYASNKYRTKTDTDGGRNPTFNEKYMLPLIEGLREVNVAVWNSNTLSKDDFIGSGKILLQKVLTEGYHDSTWPLTTKSGRRAGEIRVILHYTNPKGAHNATSSGPTQNAPPVHTATSMYPPSSHQHYTPPAYAAPSAYSSSQPSGHGGHPPTYVPYPPPVYPPSQPSGHDGHLPTYAPYPPPGHSPYPPYGSGGYAPPIPHGAQSPYTYPAQSYPPQAYPPYPPQGYGVPPTAPHPPY